MRTSLSLFLLLLASRAASGIAESQLNPNLTVSENELASLMTDFNIALESFWSELRQFKTIEAYKEAISDGSVVDPNAEYIPKLLEFEAAHRGENVGLLALWHVCRQAARGGESDDPAPIGRRNAVMQLSAYANCDLLPLVVSTAMNGRFDPKVYEIVSGLARNQRLPTRSRDIIRYTLATECFAVQGMRDGLEKRLAELRSGAEPSQPNELDLLLSRLEIYPSNEELKQQYQRAKLILEQLKNNDESLRLGGLNRADENGYIVRFAECPDSRSLAEMASAALFKEFQLRVGVAAPDLSVSLVDDTS